MTAIEQEVARFGNDGALAGVFNGEMPDAKAAAAMLAEALRAEALGPSFSLRADLDAARREVRDADQALASSKREQATAPSASPSPRGFIRRSAARVVSWVRRANRKAGEANRKRARLEDRAQKAKVWLADVEKSVKEDEVRAKAEEDRIAQNLDEVKKNYERALISEFNAWQSRSKRVRDQKEAR